MGAWEENKPRRPSADIMYIISMCIEMYIYMYKNVKHSQNTPMEVQGGEDV
jgi:hypothetical protein